MERGRPKHNLRLRKDTIRDKQSHTEKKQKFLQAFADYNKQQAKTIEAIDQVFDLGLEHKEILSPSESSNFNRRLHQYLRFHKRMMKAHRKILLLGQKNETAVASGTGHNLARFASAPKAPLQAEPLDLHIFDVGDEALMTEDHRKIQDTLNAILSYLSK